MKRILFITSSRDDYGLLRNLILETQKLNPETYLMITGSHLSKEFGETISEIKKDKIKKIIKKKILDTKFKENSHKVSQLGIFKFPTFQAGSMVKNQSLAFKIPDSMAITVMFGANKEDKKNEGSNKFNNPEIMKFFGNTQGLEYEDEYLYNLTSASVSKSEKATFANVGSENTNHNSRIVEGQGLTIRGTSLWSQWVGDEVIESPIEKNNNEHLVYGVRTKFEIIDDNLVYMKEEAIPFTVFDFNTWAGPTKLSTAKYQYVDGSDTPSLYTYEGGNLILKKEVEKVIRNRLNNGPIEKEREDSLASDTIIPAELSLEIDGIGGMVPGDAIQTNYIQPQYNTTIELKGVPFGPYTYFQIFGLNQRVDAATWTTELVTKMRINHIPANDDVTFVKEAEEDEEEILENIEEPAEVKKIEEQVDDHVELPRIVKNEPIDPDDYENVEVVDINGKTTIPIRRANGIMGTYDYWVDTQNLISLNTNKVHLSTASTGVVQQGSTYNKLQLNMIKDFERKLPKGEAPTRNIPGEEVDIGKFEKLKNDFDKLEYFDLEKAPEMVIKVIVEKKIEVQKKKKAKEQKVNPKKPDKSTYGGRYEQNSWLYQIREDWRTLYRKQSGTGINSLSGQKQSYNPKQYTTVNNKQVEAYNIVRAQLSFSVRKAWWDENIEAPNASGKSVLTSLADIDLQSIRETGFLRQDKGIYWTGKYNPNFED